MPLKPVKPLPPQAPGAPGWKTAGVFSVITLVVGLGYALDPAEGGRRLDVYLDSAGIPTSCKGIIGPEVTRRYKAGLEFTDAECEALETAYLTKMVTVMQPCVPLHVRQEMTYGEWMSWGHWSYNTGTASFCNSNTGRKLQQGDHAGACMAMGQWTWITVGGKKRDCRTSGRLCPGIVTRRDNEMSWCLEALP